MNPWKRIIRAAERGTGLRLSAEEVWRLSFDDSILRAAEEAEEEVAPEKDKEIRDPLRRNHP